MFGLFKRFFGGGGRKKRKARRASRRKSHGHRSVPIIRREMSEGGDWITKIVDTGHVVEGAAGAVGHMNPTVNVAVDKETMKQLRYMGAGFAAVHIASALIQRNTK